MKKSVVSIGQREQITRWWMPALLSSLKKKYNLSILYIEEPLSVDSKKNWFYVDRKICFPLFVEGLSIGCIVSLSELSSLQSVEDIRWSIDSYLTQIHSEVFFNRSSIQKESENSLLLYSKPFVLIKGKTEKEIIQKSHGLYLKTHSFAFLVMNEKEWLKAVSLENMDGVFICIPSFYKLSTQHKRILKKELGKPLPCIVSLGWVEGYSLPLKWESFLTQQSTTTFHPISPV